MGLIRTQNAETQELASETRNALQADGIRESETPGGHEATFTFNGVRFRIALSAEMGYRVIAFGRAKGGVTSQASRAYGLGMSAETVEKRAIAAVKEVYAELN